LLEHAKGKVRSTKDRRPLKLIHYEYFIDKVDAKAREIFLKSGFGRNQLKESLKRTLTNLAITIYNPEPFRDSNFDFRKFNFLIRSYLGIRFVQSRTIGKKAKEDAIGKFFSAPAYGFRRNIATFNF